MEHQILFSLHYSYVCFSHGKIIFCLHVTVSFFHFYKNEFSQNVITIIIKQSTIKQDAIEEDENKKTV